MTIGRSFISIGLGATFERMYDMESRRMVTLIASRVFFTCLTFVTAVLRDTEHNNTKHGNYETRSTC